MNVLKYETTELNTMKCTYRHNIRSPIKEKYVSGKSLTNKQTNIEVRRKTHTRKEKRKRKEKENENENKTDQVYKTCETGNSLKGCFPYGS